MKNKKLLFALVGVIGLLVIIIGFRLLTPEDTWVCKNGSWVRHGNPADQMPNVEDCK